MYLYDDEDIVITSQNNKNRIQHRYNISNYVKYVVPWLSNESFKSHFQ